MNHHGQLQGDLALISQVKASVYIVYGIMKMVEVFREVKMCHKLSIAELWLTAQHVDRVQEFV